jgi:predicted DNA-binding transcriptional regulator
MTREPRTTDFARAFSEALGLPRTARRIIDALVRTRARMGVDDIVRRVRSSERSVRENLTLLVRRGVLDRQVFVTTNKKLAYRYSLRPVAELVATARGDLSRTLKRIERIGQRLRETTRT